MNSQKYKTMGNKSLFDQQFTTEKTGRNWQSVGNGK
jgi:hypothetical protein